MIAAIAVVQPVLMSFPNVVRPVQVNPSHTKMSSYSVLAAVTAALAALAGAQPQNSQGQGAINGQGRGRPRTDSLLDRENARRPNQVNTPRSRTVSAGVQLTPVEAVALLGAPRPLKIAAYNSVQGRTMQVEDYILNQLVPAATSVLSRSIRVRCQQTPRLVLNLW